MFWIIPLTLHQAPTVCLPSLSVCPACPDTNVLSQNCQVCQKQRHGFSVIQFIISKLNNITHPQDPGLLPASSSSSCPCLLPVAPSWPWPAVVFQDEDSVLPILPKRTAPPRNIGEVLLYPLSCKLLFFLLLLDPLSSSKLLSLKQPWKASFSMGMVMQVTTILFLNPGWSSDWLAENSSHLSIQNCSSFTCLVSSPTAP